MIRDRDAEIAQHVVDVGRDEHRGGGLRKHHLVAGRREFVDHVRVPGALRHVEAGDLVVERPVAAVRGQALDRRCRSPRCARAGRPAAAATMFGRALSSQGAEEVAVARLLLGRADAGVFAAVPGAVVVLHVDEQQRGPGGVDRDFAARNGCITPLAPQLPFGARQRRGAGAAPMSSCPRSSAIEILADLDLDVRQAARLAVARDRCSRSRR